MLINLKHRTTGAIAFIETDGYDPDEPVTPVINSDKLEELLTYELNNSSGFYGHLININSTTNLDLSAATRKLPSFEFISIDQEVEPTNLPEEVQT